jgi:ribonuclease P protein component
MLPKKHRFALRQHPDFWKTANQYSSPTLQIQVKRNAEIFQAAVSVAKKVAPLAVDRNRMKRQIHQVLQQELPQSPTLFGKIIVLRVKRKFTNQEELTAELKKFIEWLGVTYQKRETHRDSIDQTI